MLRTEWVSRDQATISVTTIDTAGLGNRSYVADADGWAVAVDVQRDLDRVEAVLERRGARLAVVVETHVHNDYVTGGPALARRHGARYVVPVGPALRFPADRVLSGEEIQAGPLLLRTIAAPGHTDTHTVYTLHAGHEPADAAFTGGSLLLGGSGRTDLLGIERAEELARQQYWTVRRLARLLPGRARLLPTHGFGSFCLAGEAVPTEGDTLADQLTVNPAYLLDEDSFVADLLSRLGPVPAYFSAMADRNIAGPLAADLAAPPLLTLEQVARLAAAGTWVVDVRPREQYAAAHVPGSISVDAAGALATWTGWVVPRDEPIVLVATDEEQLARAQRELTRIGVDHVAGALLVTTLPLLSRGSLRRVGFREVARANARPDQPALLDVRNDQEWRTGHVRGARHLPAYDAGTADLSRTGGSNPWVYCGVGFRASVAASLLQRRGLEPVIVDADLLTAAAEGVLWCEASTCPDDRCTAPSS